MPCMNSMSACDRGGSVGLVVGGRLLLGSPGAPGWTTAGNCSGVCVCACTTVNGRHTQAVAPNSTLKTRLASRLQMGKSDFNTAIM